MSEDCIKMGADALDYTITFIICRWFEEGKRKGLRELWMLCLQTHPQQSRSLPPPICLHPNIVELYAQLLILPLELSIHILVIPLSEVVRNGWRGSATNLSRKRRAAGGRVVTDGVGTDSLARIWLVT